MKYFKPSQNYYAGFCATLNNAINVCQQYYSIFNDTNLILDVPELVEILEQNKFGELGYEDFEPIWLSSNFDNTCNANTVCDLEVVKLKKVIFDKFFKLKNLELYLSERGKFITPNTLAVQIRGTDKLVQEAIPPYKNIVGTISEILNRNKEIDRIFIATDEYKYQKLVQDEFGDLVVFREKTISYDGMPIHFVQDRIRIFKEVMMDVFLLSSCNYFLYSYSNVSFTSLILGAENWKEITCLVS